MNLSQNRLALLVALLLLTSAALFAVGTAIEHSQRPQHHDEHSAAATATATSGETKGESSNAGSAETTHTESASPTATSKKAGAEQNSEKIAGIDPESRPLVALAIAASVVLAAGVYWRRSRLWLGAAAGFAILFAAGDIREIVHQLNESRTTVATIAGVLIALHLLVMTAALAALNKRRGVIRESVAIG